MSTSQPRIKKGWMQVLRDKQTDKLVFCGHMHKSEATAKKCCRPKHGWPSL